MLQTIPTTCFMALLVRQINNIILYQYHFSSEQRSEKKQYFKNMDCLLVSCLVVTFLSFGMYHYFIFTLLIYILMMKDIETNVFN